MGDVSEESLLDYFSSSGGGSGRVRNADILRTFKAFIGHTDPQLRGKFGGGGMGVLLCLSIGEEAYGGPGLKTRLFF